MNTILYLTHPLNAILILFLVVGLGMWVTRHFKLGWRLFWIGSATFVLSQIGHIPFNIYVLNPFLNKIALPALQVTWRTPLVALSAGLSAGIFEEFARYAVYRWWAKDARSVPRGILFGAGHGGIEAIIIAVLVLLTFIQMLALQGRDLSAFVPPQQLAAVEQAFNAYWSATWYDSLLGALERAFALPVQVALSVLVLQAFVRGQARWLVAAIGWHALVDGLAYYGLQIWGPYAAEGIVGFLAVLSIATVWILYKQEPETPPERAEEVHREPARFADLNLPEITEDMIDRTRYVDHP